MGPEQAHGHDLEPCMLDKVPGRALRMMKEMDGNLQVIQVR